MVKILRSDGHRFGPVMKGRHGTEGRMIYADANELIQGEPFSTRSGSSLGKTKTAVANSTHVLLARRMTQLKNCPLFANMTLRQSIKSAPVHSGQCPFHTVYKEKRSTWAETLTCAREISRTSVSLFYLGSTIL